MIIGPNEPIVIPKVAQPVEEILPDYEVELVVIVGKDAKDVSIEKALEYVLGFTAGNDVRWDIGFIDLRLNAFVHRSPSESINWLSLSGALARASIIQHLLALASSRHPQSTRLN